MYVYIGIYSRSHVISQESLHWAIGPLVLTFVQYVECGTLIILISLRVLHSLRNNTSIKMSVLLSEI